jgi:hypothetical protein
MTDNGYPANERYRQRRFSFGFGISGLLAAGVAYLTFDAGGIWQNPIVAVLIGVASAGLLLWAERLVFGRGPGTPRTRKIKGDWGCPRCGAAYVPEATVCSDCRVPLVRAGDPA